MLATVAITLALAGLAEPRTDVHTQPLDLSIGHICIACKAGDQPSCDHIVRLIKQHRINVCRVMGTHSDAFYAPHAEYNERYFEGDIYVPRKFMSTKAALKNADNKWTGGLVPYEIDSAMKKLDIPVIKAAIEHIEERTCVRLRERKDERSYVQFTNKHAGCFAALGRVGGKQMINLGRSCTDKMGMVVHEILHALGFVHEHNRPDRDEYVEVHWDNIIPKQAHAFKKREAHLVDTDSQYDYGSIMHYPPWAFAKHRNKPTLTPKQSDAKMGQMAGLSELDIEKVKAAYGCGGGGGAGDITGPGGGKPYWTSRPPVWTRRTQAPQAGCKDGSRGCSLLLYRASVCKLDAVAAYCAETCGKCARRSRPTGGAGNVAVGSYLVVPLPVK